MARAKGKVTGTHLLGWCLTGQHELCPATITLSMQNKEYHCGCICHGKDEK